MQQEHYSVNCYTVSCYSLRIDIRRGRGGGRCLVNTQIISIGIFAIATTLKVHQQPSIITTPSSSPHPHHHHTLIITTPLSSLRLHHHHTLITTTPPSLQHSHHHYTSIITTPLLAPSPCTPCWGSIRCAGPDLALLSSLFIALCALCYSHE